MSRGAVLGETALRARLDEHRAAGARIVLTNGAFDLLHVGHARALEEAKACGDVLVVVVNDDASVAQNKGPRRPLVPAAERAELLAALGCVDYVVVVPDTTMDDVLARLKPDVHAKGRDYDETTLPEAATNRDLGIAMRFVGDTKTHGARNLIAEAARRDAVGVDRVVRLDLDTCQGFVQRRARVRLEADGWLNPQRWLDDKPGVYVEGHAKRYVRRVRIGADTLYAKVTRPLERKRSAIVEWQHHIALRSAGFHAPQPWLALEGKDANQESFGLLVTRELPGPSLLAWLRATPRATQPMRNRRATDVGLALRALHTARFLPRDAQAWHWIVRGPAGGGAAAFGWIDLMRLDRAGKRLMPHDAARSLVALDLSVRGLVTDRERLRVLRAYLGGSLRHARAWEERLARLRRKLADRSTYRAPPPADPPPAHPAAADGGEGAR